MPGNVLLLRAPSEDSTSPDKYEAAFSTRGYRAVSVPVLETVHTNLTLLADILREGARSPKYAGVIVTSARSCQTWRAAVQQLAAEVGSTRSTIREGEERQRDDGALDGWSSVPFYVVGEATASALGAISTAFPFSPYAPRDIRGGRESGTAEKLARFVAVDLAGNTALPLLCLTGDKNRDTLPNILNNVGLTLESVQVYATKGSSRFEDDLRSALGLQVFGPRSGVHWWIVFFAPSSAKHVLPILKRDFAIPVEHREGSSTLWDAHVAVIGPTTASSLRSELNIQVHVVAERPTAEALAEGIARWDGRNR